MSTHVATAAIVRRERGRATVEIFRTDTPGMRLTRVWVDDNEPDDVVGPILQRAAEEIGLDLYIEEAVKDHHGVYLLYAT